MDAFEKLVAEILWAEGYWVRTSVRVNLTKEEKVRIGRRSSPRWELDVVGYRGRENVLQVIECKSYLDSRGVTLAALNDPDAAADSRFKLFVDDTLRGVVLNRLHTDLAAIGACAVDAKGPAWTRVRPNCLGKRSRRVAGFVHATRLAALRRKLAARPSP